jgi:aryl-alcohol dehydrogenase-like predicted oxidoreductase
MRYRLFDKHTGLRVSELVLGAGVFGTRWGHGAEPDEARRIFDAYAEAGGNFIDTANGYQFGQSEEILGELLAGRRDDFVLATKFTMRTDPRLRRSPSPGSRPKARFRSSVRARWLSSKTISLQRRLFCRRSRLNDSTR